jgi:meso-butanediol dehydrogenase/(S,S)-butanediol dehydrogenase/diacetyl reductase
MDKGAIVTGGSRGIGTAIVAALDNAGYRVLTCGRGARPADLPASVHWMTADVSKSTDAAALVGYASAELGPLTLLVNNAGVQLEKTIGDSTDADWDLVVDINCRSVFNMSRGVLPVMQEHGGSIVNIGSISGNVADPLMALYNASKAFVHGLIRSIAVDHGPQVRCNAISPGWIMTEMATDGFALADDPDCGMRDAIACHPVGRMGKPEDIANAVLWLASDQSHYVNGACITVDGGMTAASPLNPGLF